MLYRLTRPFATIAFYVCFRKIHFSHQERIPWDKPIIFAANHPSAFLEPCLLACWLPKPLYFLARGNLFDHPIFAAMLRSWHLVPVYRAEESGLQAVRQNFQSFAYCYKTLQAGRPIMILAEGSTVQEKRLRPLKKGTARVAFGAVDFDPQLDLHVVPVGVNYTDSMRWRTEAMVDFGPPIRVKDYWAQYRDNPMRAMRAFTQELQRRLESRVIIIRDPKDDEWVEVLLSMDRHNRPLSIWPLSDCSDEPLQREKAITERVYALNETQRAELEAKVSAWHRLLETHRTTDLAVAQPGWDSPSVRMALAISWLPALLGWGFHYLPVRLGRYIADTQVVRLEFKLSVALGVALGATLLWYLLWAVGLAVFIGVEAVAWLFVLGPLLGILAIWRLDLASCYAQARSFNRLSNEIQQLLRRHRKALLDFFYRTTPAQSMHT